MRSLWQSHQHRCRINSDVSAHRLGYGSNKRRTTKYIVTVILQRLQLLYGHLKQECQCRKVHALAFTCDTQHLAGRLSTTR